MQTENKIKNYINIRNQCRWSKTPYTTTLLVSKQNTDTYSTSNKIPAQMVKSHCWSV